MQVWVNLADWLHTEMIYLPEDHPSTNWARCELTSFMQRTPPTVKYMDGAKVGVWGDVALCEISLDTCCYFFV